MEEDKVVSKEDLDLIKNSRNKVQFSMLKAEKASLEAKTDELEYKNAILNMYLKYGLTLDMLIDENTGAVTKRQVHQIPEVSEGNQ
jgi:hypothetical protein